MQIWTLNASWWIVLNFELQQTPTHISLVILQRKWKVIKARVLSNRIRGTYLPATYCL